MTAGARPGLINLHREYRDRVEFASVYVREAHPGEKHPRHTSDEQKLRDAREWKTSDRIPWTVAVDTLDGAVDRAYGPLPNAAYLIDSGGHVAFRALWAGQERLLRSKISELLGRLDAGETRVNLGQAENLLIPLIHAGPELDRALSRGGEKAKADFRRAFGMSSIAIEKVMAPLQPWINPGNRGIEGSALMDPEDLRRDLREGGTGHLNRRRAVMALSIVGMANMSAVALHQTGVLKRLPNPPLQGFDSERVELSRDAYRFGAPDGAYGVASLGLNLPLAAFGGVRRAEEHPWIPLIAAGKAAVDAAAAGWYLYKMPVKDKSWSAWCLAGAAINFSILALLLPEARTALKTIRNRRH